MRVDDAVGAVAVHGVAGFLGLLWVGLFAAGYPTGLNNVESSIGGQLMGMMTFLPLGFLSGWGSRLHPQGSNLLRVPPEVELEGLDLAEYGELVYPEHGVSKRARRASRTARSWRRPTVAERGHRRPRHEPAGR